MTLDGKKARDKERREERKRKLAFYNERGEEGLEVDPFAYTHFLWKRNPSGRTWLPANILPPFSKAPQVSTQRLLHLNWKLLLQLNPVERCLFEFFPYLQLSPDLLEPKLLLLKKEEEERWERKRERRERRIEMRKRGEEVKSVSFPRGRSLEKKLPGSHQKLFLYRYEGIVLRGVADSVEEDRVWEASVMTGDKSPASIARRVKWKRLQTQLGMLGHFKPHGTSVVELYTKEGLPPREIVEETSSTELAIERFELVKKEFLRVGRLGEGHDPEVLAHWLGELDRVQSLMGSLEMAIEFGGDKWAQL